MLRRSLVQNLRPTLRTAFPARTFAISASRMGEGDTGATRSGGEATGDAFTKRENASENYYVKQKEMEKLEQLKQKIAGHQEHLKELDKHVNDQLNASKKQGGQGQQ